MNVQLQLLIEKYINNTCSKEELETFFLLVSESADDKQLEEALKTIWEKTKSSDNEGGLAWDVNMQFLMDGLEQETPVIPMKRTTKWMGWKRIAVAASIVLAVGVGFWGVYHGNNNKVEIEDIAAPLANQAIIKLSNGKQIYLDKALAGTLGSDGNANVIKTADGKIVYETGSHADAETAYNTLINPLGSQVMDITLADGTKVWLNAGSTLRFPVTFTGTDRKVVITGEAYFEVAHNVAKPFKVSKGDMEVTVLGTHFNVNAYDNETDIKVTLLEGSVKATKQNKHAVILKPGEQARIKDKIEVQKDIDLSQVVAWKEGIFKFKDTKIEEIMRQVSRWYDVEVTYEGNVSDLTFGGSMSRQANLSSLLKRLEATETVKFQIKDKKLYVMPMGK